MGFLGAAAVLLLAVVFAFCAGSVVNTHYTLLCDKDFHAKISFHDRDKWTTGDQYGIETADSRNNEIKGMFTLSDPTDELLDDLEVYMRIWHNCNNGGSASCLEYRAGYCGAHLWDHTCDLYPTVDLRHPDPQNRLYQACLEE